MLGALAFSEMASARRINGSASASRFVFWSSWARLLRLMATEKNLGAEHPTVARDLNNLAQLLQVRLMPLLARAGEQPGTVLIYGRCRTTNLLTFG